jgi:DNA-binding PadR family transcriptional regulator
MDGGDLRLALLALLEAAPAHGYELIKTIEERTGGGYSPSPGVIYPTLTLLEEQGLVAVDSVQGSRKLYALTEAGRAHLGEQREMAEAVLARLTDGGEAERPAQLVRAVENLKMALRLRLARGTPGVAEIEAIAAALDTAALAVERA